MIGEPCAVLSPRSIALVIPCFNEAGRLSAEPFLRWLQQPEFHIIFVNDGSTDGTLRILRSWSDSIPRVQVLDLPGNCGKAEAVRQGILSALAQAKFRYLGYWDADLATPLEEAGRFLRVLEEQPRVGLVMGCRLQRLGARIRRSEFRHYSGRVVASLISLLLGLATYDTQCGAKLLRAEFCSEVFGEPFCTRWFFDVEVLARMRNRWGAAVAAERIVELPLESWHDQPGSKISAVDMARVLPDLWSIYRHYGGPRG